MSETVKVASEASAKRLVKQSVAVATQAADEALSAAAVVSTVRIAKAPTKAKRKV